MKISQKIFLLIIHKKNRPKIDGKSLARYLYPLTLSVDSTVKNIDNSLRKNGIARGYSTSICVARKKVAESPVKKVVQNRLIIF